MKKKILVITVLLAFMLAITGCYTNNHIIGSGAKGGTEMTEKQWYALWGLVPINNVNTNSMAGDVNDYQITTSHSFVDLLISAFTGIVTIQVKSVTVKK